MQFDLIVIGAGSGGVRVARLAAQSGAKVAVIEDGQMGGTCVNLGCVPKKLYVNAGMFPHYARLATDYGWSSAPGAFSMARLKAAKDKEIQRLRGLYHQGLMSSGVSVFDGRGRVVEPGRVQVNNDLLHAPRVLIATGSAPSMPQDFPGIELANSSNALFSLTTIPERSIVYGGGYIAVEMAGILARLGSRVTLVYRGERVLKHFDPDLVTSMQNHLAHDGVELRLNTRLSRLAQDGQTVVAHTHNGDALSANFVLFALGRHARLKELGLSLAGQGNGQLALGATANGCILVDQHYATSTSGIFALGDVTGGPQLTPLAIAQAVDFAAKHFGHGPAPRMPRYIPTCIFSQPPMATVGAQEAELQRHGKGFVCFTGKFTPMHLALGKHHEQVHYKLLVDSGSRRVLGAHLLGDYAGEIIQSFAAAMEAGLIKDDLDATLAIHPSIAEELVTNYVPSYIWPQPEPAA